MKKFVLALITLCGLASVNKAGAQVFTIPKDTVKVVGTDGGAHANNVITNITSSDIQVTWKVVVHNMPSGTKWTSNFGICDNKLCYGSELLGTPGPSRTTDAIPPGTSAVKGMFELSMTDLSGVTQLGPYYATVELKSGAQTDSVTFVVNKWPTAVSNTSKLSDNIVVYPNPAHDEVNIVFNGLSDVKTLALVNMIGSVIDVYKVSGNSAKINIENAPAGVYMLRLTDSHGHVVANKKFTHQ